MRFSARHVRPFFSRKAHSGLSGTLAVALLLAVFFASSCARRPIAPPAETDPGGYAVAGRGIMHYVESGSGAPVILLPGLFATHRTWDRVVPYLRSHYRLLAVDNFGTGRSATPSDGFRYSVAEQADMIVAMMDALHISRSHLVGVSYGGMIAMNIAARYPERVATVVCIEGGVIMPKKAPYPMLEYGLDSPVVGDTIIGLIKSGLFDETMAEDIMGPAWADMTDDDKSELLGIISSNTRSSSRRTWLGLAHAMNNARDFTDEASAITAPVLYLSGDKSSFRRMTEMNIAYFKDNLPNVEVLSFKDGVHDLELQKPKETAALIRDFIDRHSSPVATRFALEDRTDYPHSQPVPHSALWSGPRPAAPSLVPEKSSTVCYTPLLRQENMRLACTTR